MQAAVFHGPDDLRVEEVERPTAGPGEVLLAVERCGICGTDSHIVRGHFPAPNLPLIIGHEFSGTVVAIGSGVTHVEPGDRATADINIACGTCYFCRHGNKLFCPYVRQLGVHDAGGMAEYVAAPAGNVYALPDSMPFDHAAFIEPLACAIHGQDRIGVDVGETVLVIGAGPMGLAHVAMSRLHGAAQVIVSEPDPARRQRAHQLGSDVEVDPLSGGLDDVMQATGGRGADVVIEAVGMEVDRSLLKKIANVAHLQRGSITAVELAFSAARRQGRVSIMGVYGSTYDNFPLGQWLDKGLRVQSGQATVHNFIDELMQMIVSGKL
jgi:2-desacetyl-2-hydroxyethyl bacteriochlorophyllide A dehydrogenase